MRLAAVQAAPVFLDRDASTEKAVALIEQAGRGGADLVAFPEGFLPGHPGWVELLPFDTRALGLSARLFENAVEVPGPAVAALAAACREAETAAVVGICERVPRTTGTLFNTQLHIDSEGTVAGRHQKFVPTVGERLVHAPGTTGSATAFRLGDTTVSGLICGENSNPLAIYACACAYPVVHVAAWPQHFSPELAMAPVIEFVSRSVAYALKAFVVNSVAAIDETVLAAYGDESTLPFLRSDAAGGRASIVGPTGDVLAEAGGDADEIVYCDVDPSAVIAPKFVHDVAGHYNRPELFADLLWRGDASPGTDALRPGDTRRQP